MTTKKAKAEARPKPLKCHFCEKTSRTVTIIEYPRTNPAAVNVCVECFCPGCCSISKQLGYTSRCRLNPLPRYLVRLGTRVAKYILKNYPNPPQETPA